MLASSPLLVALGASERARDSRCALALKMCMFIQEHSLCRSIVFSDLFSHSVSSRRTEQIRIINRTVKKTRISFFLILFNIFQFHQNRRQTPREVPLKDLLETKKNFFIDSHNKKTILACFLNTHIFVLFLETSFRDSVTKIS